MKSNVILSMTATMSAPHARVGTHGRIDLLDTGEVRWSLFAPGSSKVLLSVFVDPGLISKSDISTNGAIALAEGWALSMGSAERAERFRSAVRNVSYSGV